MINLKEKRIEKGMTQQQLAEKVFCERQHISNIERGRFRPSVELAKSIAKELGFAWIDFYE